MRRRTCGWCPPPAAKDQFVGHIQRAIRRNVNPAYGRGESVSLKYRDWLEWSGSDLFKSKSSRLRAFCTATTALGQAVVYGDLWHLQFCVQGLREILERGFPCEDDSKKDYITWGMYETKIPVVGCHVL
eukprot:tig00020539_g10404.t1